MKSEEHQEGRLSGSRQTVIWIAAGITSEKRIQKWVHSGGRPCLKLWLCLDMGLSYVCSPPRYNTHGWLAFKVSYQSISHRSSTSTPLLAYAFFAVSSVAGLLLFCLGRRGRPVILLHLGPLSGHDFNSFLVILWVDWTLKKKVPSLLSLMTHVVYFVCLFYFLF